MLDASSVAIEQANELAYQSLEKSVVSMGKEQSCSLTEMSLSSLKLPSQKTVIPSTSLDIPYEVTVQTLKLSSEMAAVGVFRVLGIQMGLFHGGKLLCPIVTDICKATPNEEGVLEIQKVRRTHVHLVREGFTRVKSSI